MSCRQCEHPLEKGIHTCGEKPKDEWRPTVTMVAGTATDIEYWLTQQVYELHAENARLREQVGPAPPDHGDPLGQETYKQRCERITKEFPDTMRVIIEAALRWAAEDIQSHEHPVQIWDAWVRSGLAALTENRSRTSDQ